MKSRISEIVEGLVRENKVTFQEAHVIINAVFSLQEARLVDPYRVEERVGTWGVEGLEKLCKEPADPLDENLAMTTLAIKCRKIYDKAVKDLGSDLGGHSALDLVADQLPSVSLTVLRNALIVAGIH